ncbi:MAG: BrnT family toxin [Candidatus Latescibacterota bacterium]
MLFEWDEAKNQSNIDKHGIHFSDAKEIFKLPVCQFVNDQAYGETRILAIGLLDHIEITVIYTIRDEKIRLISARRASQNERRKYQDFFG